VVTNGHIDEAELDLLLDGTDRAIDRYLVTSMRELHTGLIDVKGEVAAMRQVCETRGLMCPGMHSHMADPVTEPPTKLSRETWLMWGLGTGVLRGFALPLLVAVVVVIVSRFL
jgi:hypothetical protein